MIKAALMTASLLAAAALPAAAFDLVALTERNELIRFSDAKPAETAMVAITGTEGRVLGIDVRPVDKKLYALDDKGILYTLDPRTGFATKGATLSAPLEDTGSAIVDFNPQADRMRVIGPRGQSLRVNVESGQTIVDGRLRYSDGDANVGKLPRVMAGAYLNSIPNAPQTQLFEFDSATGAYIIQDPPNDGLLQTIGASGLPAGTAIDAMDIHTTPDMRDYTGFAVAANNLYRFGISSGRFTPVGPIGAGSRKIVDIAVLP
ncbi:MAG: DUF4394 domain-containing protein [Alphaproteobacteria bacterium]|nr:DUF4394 domain-containing protein [Alphaproteobacteria bacterium]